MWNISPPTLTLSPAVTQRPPFQRWSLSMYTLMYSVTLLVEGFVVVVTAAVSGYSYTA